MQACHACIEVARTFLSPGDEHPHLVLIGAESEAALNRALSRFKALGIRCRSFCDDDLGGELTSFATEPVQGAVRRHFRRYRCLRAPESALHFATRRETSR